MWCGVVGGSGDVVMVTEKGGSGDAGIPWLQWLTSQPPITNTHN